MSPSAIVLVLLIAASVVPGAQSDYQKQILTERQQDQARLQAEDGPIHFIGHHAIDEGRTTLGSAAGSTITLPQRAPAHLGTIERSAGTATFTPSASVPVALDGKRIEGPITLPTKGKADKVRAGDFSFTAQSKGESMTLLLWDRQSSFAKNFHGPHWFPVDPACKVQAKFTPYANAESAKVPDTQGGIREMPFPDSLPSSLGKKHLSLMFL